MRTIILREGCAFKGKVHASITLIIMYGFNPNLDLNMFNIWFIAGGTIGSYLPDSDHRYATAGTYLPLWWLGIRHRAQTHSLFMCAIFSLIGTILNIWLGAGLALGYILHLFGDRMTYMGMKHGLPYFWWFPGKKKLP